MKRIIALSSLVLAIGFMSFVTTNTKTNNNSDGDKCCVSVVALKDGRQTGAGACADTYDEACDKAEKKADAKVAALK